MLNASDKSSEMKAESKDGCLVVALTFFIVVAAFGILYLHLILFRDSIDSFYHPRL